MTKFRPCIDLHEGKVKQIVGGSLDTSALQTNFESDRPASWYAELYAKDQVQGAHIIQLGPGNSNAATSALNAWPNSMQLGGGITPSNASDWLEKGASHVIVTSYLFEHGEFQESKLQEILKETGKDKLVLDLSFRRVKNSWFITTNRWQTITSFELTQANIQSLEDHCDEFLIHAADVEGLQNGIDSDVVEKLSQWVSIPTTYAGGAKSLQDLELVHSLSQGKIDLTIGSALDIFGGQGVRYQDCLDWNFR